MKRHVTKHSSSETVCFIWVFYFCTSSTFMGILIYNLVLFALDPNDLQGSLIPRKSFKWSLIMTAANLMTRSWNSSMELQSVSMSQNWVCELLITWCCSTWEWKEKISCHIVLLNHIFFSLLQQQTFGFSNNCFINNKSVKLHRATNYRGSPPYAFFGTWKKTCYMKFVLVGLYCGPLLTLIPPLTRT